MTLLSCEDIYQQECTIKTWSLEVSSDSAAFPDSVSWRGPWETGTGRMARGSTGGRLELDLRHPLDQDTLELQWRQMGIRRKTVWCVRAEEPGRLKVVRESQDSLGSILLASFWSRRTASPANLEPATAAGLRTFLAGRLLAGDSLFRPFPAKIPAEIGPDTARLDAWVAACRSGWPMFRVLGTWNLSTDSVALRKGVEGLVKAGRLASSDTSALFQYPLGVRKALVQADILQGDSSRPSGTFWWAFGLDVQVEASVRLRNYSTDSIAVEVVAPPGPRDTSWDASKGVVLRVGRATAAGVDTLLVRLKDRQGRYEARSSAVFKVLPRPGAPVVRDTVPPILAHRSVPDSVDWSTKTLTVEWQVKDQTPKDTIWIAGSRVPLDPTGFYRHQMTLSVEKNVVVLVAKDSAGNPAHDTIRIVRRKDLQPPTFQRTSATASWTVPFDSTRATVEWKVADNRGVASCRIDDVEALAGTGPGGWYCRARVDLVMGANVVALRVQDTTGLYVHDTLRIERLKDATVPTARPISGEGTREVPFDSAAAWVGWDVADSYGLKSCFIDRSDRLERTAGGGWTCRIRIPLSVGPNVVRMEVKDSTENGIRDSIVVRRARDLSPPLASPLGGLRRILVPFDSTRVTVGWTVSDNDSVSSCTINLSESLRHVGKDSGICQSRVDLAVGERVVALVATDTSRNTTLDTIRIQRDTDRVAPKVVALAGLGSRTVPFDSASVTVAWKATDNHKVVSCSIEGVARPLSSAGTCSLAVRPPVGTATFRVVVEDSTSNKGWDSVVVRRLTDTVPPVARAIGGDTLHADSTVASYVVRWLVTDNDTLREVTYNSWPRPRNGDTVETSIVLKAGHNGVSITAFDTTGNKTIGKAVVVRDAQAPRHRTDSVYYGGSVPDTLSVPGGADSVEISKDGTTWSRVDGVAMLDAPGTWYARSWPGKATTSVFLRQAPLTENVFAGVSTSFFVRGDSLFAAGRNDAGQLGIGSRSSRVLSPVFVRKGVKKVVAGEDFSLMLLSDGQVVGAGAGPLVGWRGGSAGGDLYQVSTESVDIAAGRDFFLVLDRLGRLWAAGTNDKGQLGTGDSIDRGALVQSGAGVRAIAAGWSHAVRLDSAGKVWAVGGDAGGQLGALPDRDAKGWHLVDSSSDAVYSSMGDVTLFRGSDRVIRGLGANDHGQISGSADPVVRVPTKLWDAEGAWASGGASHTLVLLTNGHLKVAGSNLEGQLGMGSSSGSTGFSWLPELDSKVVAAGRDHSLVVKSTGEPVGMGANSEGELGQGAVGEKRLPVRIWY